MDEQISNNLKKLGTWKRLFFMLVFGVIMALVRTLLWGVVILQIGSLLLTGKVNTHILNFGRSLSVYIYHILLFLTFNTDSLPFPFADWDLTAELKLPE
jgi:type IV secretory pathway TrbL component